MTTIEDNTTQETKNEYNSDYTTFSLSPTNTQGTISDQLKHPGTNKHRMSPQTNEESSKKPKTTEEMQNEEIENDMDMQIKQRSEQTLDKILSKINNHISMEQIKITKSENKLNSKNEKSKKHHG